MKLVDSHCHLEMAEFDADRDAVLARYRAAGGVWLLNPGCDLESSHRARDLAHRHPEVWFAPGIHPHDARELTPADLTELKDLLADPRCLALGEIGLDYYRDRQPRAVQRAMFEQLLALAVETTKKIIIHSRDADDELVAIVGNYRRQLAGGVLHCYSSGPAATEFFLELGFYISVAGPVTFPKADGLRAAVRDLVPLDRLLIETDAPYLAPQSRRGKRNEPALVAETAAAVALLKGLTPEALADLTAANAAALFGPGDGTAA